MEATLFRVAPEGIRRVIAAKAAGLFRLWKSCEWPFRGDHGKLKDRLGITTDSE